MLSVRFIYYYAKCRYAERRFAKCRGARISVFNEVDNLDEHTGAIYHKNFYNCNLYHRV